MCVVVVCSFVSNSIFYLCSKEGRQASSHYLPWLDLLGLNIMAGVTVLGVPVEQMITTENVPVSGSQWSEAG